MTVVDFVYCNTNHAIHRACVGSGVCREYIWLYELQYTERASGVARVGPPPPRSTPSIASSAADDRRTTPLDAANERWYFLAPTRARGGTA